MSSHMTLPCPPTGLCHVLLRDSATLCSTCRDLQGCPMQGVGRWFIHVLQGCPMQGVGRWFIHVLQGCPMQGVGRYHCQGLGQS